MKPKHKKNPRFRTEMGAILDILANPTEVNTIWGNKKENLKITEGVTQESLQIRKFQFSNSFN